MNGMIHRREAEWDGIPFATMADIAEFATELDSIVSEAVPEPPRKVGIELVYEYAKTGWLSASEFRDALTTLAPLSEITHLFMGSTFVDEEEPAAKTDKSEFRASLYIGPGVDGLHTRLGVEGRKLTAVEGVRATAKAFLDRQAEATRRAEKEKAKADAEESERRRQAEIAASILKADIDRQREQQGRKAEAAEGTGGRTTDRIRVGQKSGREGQQHLSSPPPRWKRFFYNPWIVAIGSGLIVGVVILLITQ